MMRIWTPLPFVCLVAAIWQWAEIADRIHHLARFVSKFGIEPGLITAGSSMVFGFHGATAFFSQRSRPSIISNPAKQWKQAHHRDGSQAEGLRR